MRFNWRIGLLVGLAGVSTLIAFLLPPIAQDPAYHGFADSRTLFGVPNFWNVVSNVPFLLAALWGFYTLGRFGAHTVLFAGLALVAFGSGYYHWNPNNDTLFWDRLPMTVVFMTLLAVTVRERVGSETRRSRADVDVCPTWLLLLPLLAAGVGSLVVWRSTGDLRAYGLVQFYPMLALPLILILFPARGSWGVWAMIGFYVLAKGLELADHAPFSGHPWKHVAGAVAMLCYVEGRRRGGKNEKVGPDCALRNKRLERHASYNDRKCQPKRVR
jgi:hypothetical protein